MTDKPPTIQSSEYVIGETPIWREIRQLRAENKELRAQLFAAQKGNKILNIPKELTLGQKIIANGVAITGIACLCIPLFQLPTWGWAGFLYTPIYWISGAFIIAISAAFEEKIKKGEL